MDVTGRCESGVEVLTSELNSAGELAVVGLNTPLPDSEFDDPEKSYSSESDEKPAFFDVEALPAYYSAIRLAPLCALSGFSFGLIGPAYTELMKLRVCGPYLNYSDAICYHLDERIYDAEAAKVRTATAQFQLYNTLIGTLPSILLSVLLGSWSDQYGRKLTMLVPFAGTLLAHAFLVLCAFANLHPAFLLLSPIIGSLTGGQVITFMAMFSYIGDYTTKKTRSSNIALIDGCLFVAGSGGTFLSGYTLEKFGLPVPFIADCGLTILAFLYILFVIRDHIPRKKLGEFRIGSLFSLVRVMENWEMLKQQRPGQTRRHIHVTLFCMFLTSVCLMGDGSIMQLFLEFKPFYWTVGNYSLFSSINGLVGSVTFVAAVILLRKVFGVPDTMLAVIATLSAIGMFFGYAIALHNWVIYVASAVGIFRGFSMVAIRSLLCGMVDRAEIGKIMSLISSTHSLSPLLATLIFTNVFAYTAAWWPGFCFILGAFMLIPVLAGFAYVDVARRGADYAYDHHHV